MKKVEKGKTVFYVFDQLFQFDQIKHFVSTRHGGQSKGVYASLNLGFGTEDDPEIVLENRKLLAASMGIPLGSFVLQNQVHGSKIQIVTSEMKGFGAFTQETSILETDALITAQKGICLFAMAADCVPVLLFDPKQNVIAAVHAGWRGTFKKITELTILKMKQEFHCDPNDIYAGIGPSIGSCCYEVGEDVIQEVLKAYGTTDNFIYEISPGKFKLDLWYANQLQCKTAGIPSFQIEISHFCTHCNHHDFFSSRFDKGVTGRFGVGIMLK